MPRRLSTCPTAISPTTPGGRIADRTFSREELGLPQTGFVFCCFNNNYKITPGTFDSWMRILERVEGSVLWLLEDNALATSNLRQGGERAGASARTD